MCALNFERWSPEACDCCFARWFSELLKMSSFSELFGRGKRSKGSSVSSSSNPQKSPQSSENAPQSSGNASASATSAPSSVPSDLMLSLLHSCGVDADVARDARGKVDGKSLLLTAAVAPRRRAKEAALLRNAAVRLRASGRLGRRRRRELEENQENLRASGAIGAASRSSREREPTADKKPGDTENLLPDGARSEQAEEKDTRQRNRERNTYADYMPLHRAWCAYMRDVAARAAPAAGPPGPPGAPGPPGTGLEAAASSGSVSRGSCNWIDLSHPERVLLGARLRVVTCAGAPQTAGCVGIVVRETRRTVRIRCEDRARTLVKSGTQWRCESVENLRPAAVATGTFRRR